MAAMARSGSPIRLDSVISSVTAEAGTSTAAIARATSPTNDGSRRLRGEMLTATPSARPDRRHPAQASRDCRRTARVSGVMRPLCSATGTNSSGATRPRSGWCHRTSASAPVTCPSRRRTFGWKWTVSSPLVMASFSSVSSVSCCGLRTSSSVRYLHPGPPGLGRVHRDVRPSQQVAGAHEPAATATPRLAATVTRSSSSWKGTANARRTIVRRCPRLLVQPSSPTANSSPPSRATTASLGALRDRRSATIRSKASPVWWPSVSLMSLKRSRSSRMIVAGEPEASGPAKCSSR